MTIIDEHSVTVLNAASSDSEVARDGEAFIVDIEGFEGPLHLLLALASTQKVDLRYISILHLAEQYLEFIHSCKTLRIDLAADYLLMAAWLAYMKSRLLLPKPEKEMDTPTGEEMAARLAFRLQRLNAMREVAATLMDGTILGRDVFTYGQPVEPEMIMHPQYSETLYDLLTAFGDIQKRQLEKKPHHVNQQPILSLENARQILKDQSSELKEWKKLEAIEIPKQSVPQDIPHQSVQASMLVAALELTRDQIMDLRQDTFQDPVFVRKVENGEG